MSENTLDPKFADKRTSERYIKKGLLDEKALEKHLKSLPDLAEESVLVKSTITEDEAASQDE